MKKGKKICALALSVAMIATMCSCGSKIDEMKGAKIEYSGSDIYPVKCEDKLTYWMYLDSRLTGSYDNFGDTPLAKELEKETGIAVEYLHPQNGQDAEQFNIMLASNELPDLVTYNWAGYAGGVDQAIEEGYIYQLNDAIDKYAPNLKKYLSEHPDVDKKIKTDAGNYYAFPFIRGEEWMCSAQGLILRKDWLDKLGMSEPKTLDDLEKVLEGFKTLGASAPMALTTYDLSMFFRAYGIDDDFYVDGDSIKFGCMGEQYKEALAKIQDWFERGLIDNNLVSADTDYVHARILNGDAGAFFGYVVSGIGKLLDAKPADQPDFDLIGVAQPTIDGSKPEFGYREDNVNQGYAVAVSTNCKNLELAVRYLDYGFSEAGHNLYNFGIEGESYNMVDGKPVFTDLITKNPEGLTFAEASVRYTRAATNGIFVQDPEYVKQSLTYPNQQQHAYDVWSDTNMKEHIMPPITMLPEEQSEIADIMNNVNTFVSEKKIEFVTGKADLGAYDSYVEQLSDFKIERALELYQNALERYNKR